MRRYTTSLVLLLFFPIACWANVSLTTSANDALTTAAIKAQYTKSALFNAADIHVTTNDGVVTLQGLLNANVQVKRAIELAQETHGAHQVDADDLKIRISAQPQKDQQLKTEIITTLVENKIVGKKGAGLVIEVENGVAYIDGYVNSMSERRDIIHLTKSVTGISNVRDDMRMVGLRK